MPIEINHKIVSFAVKKKDEAQQASPVEPKEPLLNRPEVVQGFTYKMTPGNIDHSVYVTFNHTFENGKPRLIEMFIVSRCMESFQWISALSRLVSAVFRNTSDLEFLVGELKQVFDPKGGYFIPGSQGKYANSVVAHIGHLLDVHIKRLQEMHAPTQASSAKPAESAGYPANAVVCSKCHTKAMVMKDGCQTCLSCGDSKCG